MRTPHRVPPLCLSPQPGMPSLASGQLLSLTPPNVSPLSPDPEAEVRKASEHNEKVLDGLGSNCLCHRLTVCEPLGTLLTLSEPQFPHSSRVRFHSVPTVLTLKLARCAGNTPDLPLPLGCCVPLGRSVLLTGPPFPYP